MSAMGKKAAYGGVVIDAHGRILLREPKHHFDGYVWTFPKGRQDAGESPEQTALREVKEETGYSAAITGKLPGSYAGGTTVTEFFLMRPVGSPCAFDRAETVAITWASIEKAYELVAQTTNAVGRARDESVLRNVSKLLGGKTQNGRDQRH